jgi:Cys-rich repeat protein
MARAFLAAVVILAACGPVGDECTTDRDCPSGTVCANTRVCMDPADVHRLVVQWTVQGFPAGTASCRAVPQLELTVEHTASGARQTYAPVPCETGRFTFDKLPDHFDRVRLRVLATGEEHRAPIPPGDALVVFVIEDAGLPEP